MKREHLVARWPLFMTALGRFESRSSRIFVILAVHIQCSKLFKGLECAVLRMVLFTIKNPWRHSKGIYNPGFGLPFLAILPSLCRKRRKAIFTHSLLTALAGGSTHVGWTMYFFISYPAYRRRWPNINLTLGQRSRPWASIETTLVECLVFSGWIDL